MTLRMKKLAALGDEDARTELGRARERSGIAPLHTEGDVVLGMEIIPRWQLGGTDDAELHQGIVISWASEGVDLLQNPRVRNALDALVEVTDHLDGGGQAILSPLDWAHLKEVLESEGLDVDALIESWEAS